MGEVPVIVGEVPVIVGDVPVIVGEVPVIVGDVPGDGVGEVSGSIIIFSGTALGIVSTPCDATQKLTTK
ncbi:hypothetical protein [Tychonema sp. LEGE 07203]|uniref:hypothetical protein n=1 Tax=Tychonema sp. LEGE 07203 TaxID=1828671 RepID=UPI00272D4257|nr:hypothetical protein [Tychonema sp. LEGE 07203]